MEIVFKPSPKQFQAWEYLTDDVTTELGYGGAAHGGKSYLGCFFEVAMCEAYPDTGWLLGRKELINLKRTTLLTFYKVCNEYGFKPDKHFKYNQQSNIIDWHNGSQIFLMDLSYNPSDPLYTRLGGLELTGAFVDESNEIPILGIETLKTRLGRRKNKEYGLLPKLLEGFNPDKAHVYFRYYKPYKTDTLPPHRKFIVALPTDNPYTTEEYLNQLRNADKVTKERLLYGNFEYDDEPNALIRYDAITDLFTNTIEQTSGKYLTVDAARYGGDKIVYVVWSGLRVIEVKWKARQGLDRTEDDIKEFARDRQIPYSHIIVDEDGVGGGIVDHLYGIKGFTANATPFEIWDTVKEKTVVANYRNLKAQCSFMLADKVNKHEIAIACEDPQIREWIIEELSQIKSKDIDKDAKLQVLPKDEIKERLGRSPDFADALMMRMYFELKPQSEQKTTYVQPEPEPASLYGG
jgi:hypothetical protein